MLGYVTLGTNDFDRAAKFYDALLAEMGGSQMMDTETFIAWSATAGAASVAITRPFDEQAATVGNGMMVALAATSKDHVVQIYDKAIALGGTDEGAPGQRGDGFYAGYFRDLDGNELNAYFLA